MAKLKTKKLIPAIVGLLFVVIAFGAIKHFYLNNPKESPRQITQNIVDFMQTDKPSDVNKAKIASYYKQELKDKFNSTVKSKDEASSDSSSDAVISIKNVEEDKNIASSTIELQVLMFQVPVQFKFTKEGNFFAGYKWMINDIKGLGDSSFEKTEATVQSNEKVSIGKGWSIIVSSPTDYSSTDSWDKPESGMKFVAVEVEYINESDSSGQVSPSNLSLRDSESHSYEMTFMSSKKPEIESGTVVTANTNLKGFITYEVPVGATIKSAVYSNDSATVTINF